MSYTGTPVRLVRNDGKLIELFCSDIALDVERKTGGIAMPFSGSSRLGFDFNMNNAAIILNGIIVDDDAKTTLATSTRAQSTIDFATTFNSVTSNQSPMSFATTDNLTAISSSTTLTAVDHAIKLTNSAGTSYEIYFTKNSSAVKGTDPFGTSSTIQFWISIHDGSNYRTAAAIAANFELLIDNELMSHFSAAVEASSYRPTYESTRQCRS